MNPLRGIILLFLSVWMVGQSFAQSASTKMLVEPFVNKVFIQEKGQFSGRLERMELEVDEPVLYAVENAEFNAYFTTKGVHFRFAEYETVDLEEWEREEEERERGEQQENVPDTRGLITHWHAVDLIWKNANPNVEVQTDGKTHEYYNYSGWGDDPNINFVPAFTELVYHDVYQGVDAIFTLPEEGGLKYEFRSQAGVIPQVAMEWKGEVSLSLDSEGNLVVKTPTTTLNDHTPSGKERGTDKEIPMRYELDGNVVRIAVDEAVNPENGFVIDPWIVNTSYPDINAAHDIQEDAAGNVVVHGNHTNFQVQKFNSAGVLQWTYVTYSKFLGDIAVDNPGNVYIIGGYNLGKRQKLDPAGVQLWQLSGLVEEWRLAFNYSKTVLTVGGYFQDPAANNLGRMDLNTGAMSNEVIYGAETRAIATDCNGDMYSLHVTFGGAGLAPSNLLRKTDANFAPVGSVQTGFLLAEYEAAAGYVPNPDYNPNVIYQGFNGLVVSGPYLYMTDGITVRRVNKTSLAILNSAPIAGGAKLRNAGLAADLCGNIYAGSQNGIIKFDSTLNYISTIATPGAVYDLIVSESGDLLACGFGFIGSFAINCNPPAPITAVADNSCDGTGMVTVNVAGGLAPYTFEWQPGGQTTNPISGLSAGVYTYVINDAFCRELIDSVQIYQNPVPAFTVTPNTVANVNPNSVCNGEDFQFTDNSSSPDGSIVNWSWDFGDGNTSSQQNPSHQFAGPGTYTVKLVVETDHACPDSTTQQVTVDPIPVADFTATDACAGSQNVFADGSSVGTGSISSWGWDFGDGNTSAQQNPTHQFTNAGTYMVGLTATATSGCSSVDSNSVEVYALPQADFTFPSTCVNDPTDFLDASTDGTLPINSWQWDVEGQTLNGSAVQHTFSAEGTFPVQLLVEDAYGCADSVTQQVTISVRPSMSVSVNDACANTQFAFTNSSSIQSGTIDSTHWDFGDGNVSTAVSPTNTYVSAGVYNVVLYMQSDMGCASDTTFQVEAFPNPVAGLQWQNQCDGTPITLSETTSVVSPGQLVASDWNMGDGTVLNDTSLSSYLYGSFGDYTIQLSVETQDGCTDSQSFTVSVHAVPTADFSFTNICETDSVQFTDQTTIAQGNIAGWHWSFGNGQTFNGQSADYQVYPADGFYPVQLAVVSDSGCADVLDDQIEVYPAPIALFAFDSACFPGPLTFTDLSDPNGNYAINQWAWVFTNGQTSSSQSPQMNFPSYGAYGATLTITNQTGCKDEVTLGDALLHPLPVADYTANMQHCYLETLTFTDLSTLEVLSDDQITDWNYDLGDANSYASPDGTHDYASAGFYDLALTVTTNHGCADAVSRTVEVWPLPQVAFNADPQDGCDPLFVQFTDQSSIPAPYSLSNWEWTVGDGSDAIAAQSPSHVYDPVGLAPLDFISYDVGLVVTSGNGCVDSVSYADLITVHPVPQAKFSTDPERLANLVHPLFQFTDLSTENVSVWNWSFGDGSSSTVQNPEYIYGDTGTYTITLIVTTEFGCTDTISYRVEVEPYYSFYIPSAFTPNGDGRNDGFFGAGEHLIEYNMKIFDRWGELIFESNDQDYKWDGTYKGAPVEAGHYVYLFNIIDWEGNDHQYIGGVTVLR